MCCWFVRLATFSGVADCVVDDVCVGCDPIGCGWFD